MHSSSPFHVWPPNFAPLPPCQELVHYHFGVTLAAGGMQRDQRRRTGTPFNARIHVLLLFLAGEGLLAESGSKIVPHGPPGPCLAFFLLLFLQSREAEPSAARIGVCRHKRARRRIVLPHLVLVCPWRH